MTIKRHPTIPPVHPGEVIREDILPALRLSKAEIARSLGIYRQMFYDIINEKKPVTAEMAVRLGTFFGNGPEVWLNLQKSYDLEAAKLKVDTSKISVFQPAPTIPVS